MRTTPRPLIRTITAVAAVTAVLLSPGTGPAQGSPAPPDTAGRMPHCDYGTGDDGKVMREVQLRDRNFKVTHSERARIARGTEFSQTVTMSVIDQVGASISGTTTVKADAGAFFAKASAEASVTLAGNKQKTTTETREERFTIPATRKDRLFVFYEGVAVYKFRLHKRVCTRGPGEEDSYGKLSSWEKTYESGNVLCPHSRYRVNSPKYQIALAGGC